MRKPFVPFRSAITALFCLMACILSGCAAAELADPPAIGSIFPNFELRDLDGTTHTLEQYRGKVVVIEMCSHLCPYSRGADPHLVELAQKHAAAGVVVLGIDSHHETPVQDIKKYAQENNKTYPILKDEGHKFADLLGARVTPEVYVIDREGKLMYHGAFDNRERPEDRGAEAYVANAIQAVLDGRPVNPDRVKAWGCTIKRAR